MITALFIECRVWDRIRLGLVVSFIMDLLNVLRLTRTVHDILVVFCK